MQRQERWSVALSLALGVTLLLIVAVPQASAESSETKPYQLGSAPTYWPQCYANGSPMSPSYGGACFVPPSGTEQIAVTITDKNTAYAPARILFTTGYDEEQVGPVFCGSIANVAVPAGTLGINVSTSPLRTGNYCGLAKATSGTITVTSTP